MKIISSQQIEALGISPKTCVEWVREAFLLKDRAQLPPKVSLHPQGTDFINTMPCILPEEYHRYGCKIVSRIKGSTPSLKSELVLLDASTGDTLAFIDCNPITTMRTAAVAALAISELMVEGASVFSFVGLGVIGTATLDCLLATLPEKPYDVRLYRYKDHAEKTIEKFKPRYPWINFVVKDSMEALVEGADVVVSCITDAKELLVKDTSLLKPGVLVVPVHTRGFQNCDTVFERVVADDEGHVEGFQYFNEFREFVELAEVLKDKGRGRKNSADRILAYNIGLGLHDVWFANKIYEMLAK